MACDARTLSEVPSETVPETPRFTLFPPPSLDDVWTRLNLVQRMLAVEGELRELRKALRVLEDVVATGASSHVVDNSVGLNTALTHLRLSLPNLREPSPPPAPAPKPSGRRPKGKKYNSRTKHAKGLECSLDTEHPICSLATGTD
jgi:hypothetical protein